ncbi:MAG TPA: class I SAM-dependent methyltransferase [Chitinophaga sp.]|uniref:class I SAM-dependent methyltransferase n=1 Tax=Chitinophaga sp. TaxID=1869181 RepID=UPI002C99B965|nr:class I SAM-dependent methyltransferase [Chitinophaga sp.]HVI48640.1 class I SAM-dependent methyltransferase [Chitinophaga sp.]
MISNTPEQQRDYSAISPSARSLLMLKGLTTIPYVRKAAELMCAPEAYTPDYNIKDPAFWGRLVHFENRYWSINQLLATTPVNNILELSSGFSFRGLDITTQQPGIHYIETDLPDLIATKQAMIRDLQEAPPATGSQLEILPLNAMDEQAFHTTVSHFGPGPLAILNEGLLMYLSVQEKEQLCNTIREALLPRGGCWITADIYVCQHYKTIRINDKLNEFFQEHRIYENMFDDYESAEAFFREAGFEVIQRAQPDHSKLSTLPYLLQNTTTAVMNDMRAAGKMRATWKLQPL